MAYIERWDFELLRDEYNSQYAQKVRIANIRHQALQSHLNYLKKLQPLLGTDFSVFNLCRVMYTIIRDQMFFTFFKPEFSAIFHSLENIKAYVIKNPNTLMAVCYDLAIQINCYRDNEDHVIALSPNTLNQWQKDSRLTEIVCYISIGFRRKLGRHDLHSLLATNTPSTTEIVLPFNYKSKDQQHRIDKMVKTLVKICKTKYPNSPEFNIQISVQHIIKECIEVLSWVEKNPNELTFIYYENRLPNALTHIPNIQRKDSSYLTGQTIIFDRDSINLQKSSRKALNNARFTHQELMQDKRVKKVYLSMCYGADSDKYTGNKFESVVNYFIDVMKILPENIFVYLGPFEKADKTQAQSKQIEKDKLFSWMFTNAHFIKERKIKLILYNCENVRDEFQELPSLNWHYTQRYIDAEKHVIHELFKTDRKFGIKLNDAACTYLAWKEHQVEAKAEAVLNAPLRP